MSYARTYTIDASPTGDTVKAAVVDKIDPDLTSIYTNLNTHEALHDTHGATGAIVGTTNAQVLTNKTLTSPILSGTVTGTNATLVGATLSGTFTGGTLAGTTLNGTTTCASLKLTNGVFTGTITATGATLVGFSADLNNTTMTGTTTIATANIAAGTFTGILTAGTLGSTTTTNDGTIKGGTLSTATLTACTITASCTLGGTLTDPVINGAVTGTAFTKSATTIGYSKLGNGLYIQWGTQVCDADGMTTIAYDTTFPTGTLNITATPINPDTSSYGHLVAVRAATTTNFIAHTSNGDGGPSGAFSIYWMAIGY